MTGDKIIVQNLERRVRELSLLNEAYKAHIINLENTFNNLENQIQSLKLVKQDFLSKEEIYLNEKIEVAQKDQKILDLQQDIINLKIQHEKFKNKKELEYDNDVTAVKNFYQTQLLKNESSENVERINKLFYDTILKLEDKITNFEEEQKKKDAQKEIDFENRMKKKKKKMLDYIKEGQKSKQYLSKEQLRLNDKLSVIHKNALLNELDFQSMQLEDLLKQREHLDKIIVGMKSDIEVHKKVEKILTEKNKQYTNMIKVLSTKVENKDKENNKNFEKQNSLHKNKNIKENKEEKDNKDSESKYKNKKFKFWKSNDNFIRINNKNIYNEINKRNTLEKLIKSESNDNDKINKTKEKKYRKICSYLSSPNISVDNVENINDLVILRKELVKRIKESEDYKSKYHYYKTKLDELNNKYGNIMKLFEDVLIKIYEDKNMKNIKSIYVNIEEFKRCNFENLSSEQKYSIVMLIIKYLLPLINPNNLPDKFKSLFCNVENATFINEKNENNNHLLSSTSYGSNNLNCLGPDHRHNVVKSRIKSSSSDFGKTQIIFDNQYNKQINSATSININNSNNFNYKFKYENYDGKRNKKITNRHFLEFINSQGNKKGFGKTGFTFKYSSLLSNFFKSLEADSNNNPQFKRSYSLFNI